MDARDAGDLASGLGDAVEQEGGPRKIDQANQDRQEDRDPEGELDQGLARALTPAVSSDRHGVTVTVRDRVAVPPRFETTSTIV
jgi:hypothetical protein